MRSFDDYRLMVENALPGQLTDLGEIPEPLRGAMLYSLASGGKRIRPVLLLACCELLGGSAEEALPFACGLEMIHTYSLIHDDLPAMDDDDLRRGRPSNHIVYGEGMAILAGDGLLSAAAEVMLRTAIRMDSLRGAKAAEAVFRRAGVTGMVAGQTLDISLEGKPPTVETVSAIHLHKTADLITAGMEAGALLACARPEELDCAVAYGTHLGLAFQMVDDLLDVKGDPALLGKNTGLDTAHGKQTWVAVRGAAGTEQDARREAEAASAAIRGIKGDTSFFADLAEELLHRIS